MTKRRPPDSRLSKVDQSLGLDDEERRLFEQEFADVTPLRGPQRVVFEEPRPVSSGTGRRAGQGKQSIAVQHHDGKIAGSSYGVSQETLRSLARGDIHVEARCDLHGLNAEVARHSVERFIALSADAGRRAVLFVCGQGRHSDGTPVLRDVVVDVLCSRPVQPDILAFASAAPKHGGAGAIVVLLRKRR
jgi:DNA-nicking Smr family endonuclease